MNINADLAILCGPGSYLCIKDENRLMFKIFETKSTEECLCDKYTHLMHKAYKLALTDKEESDRLNARAKSILRELRRMKYDKIDY
ncbi:hypothetical protein SAMN05660903_00648 [Salegentibacter salinarum]|nr:hypothetical protein SAMN05660903_00648 [Salegentibacter salinarum]